MLVRGSSAFTFWQIGCVALLTSPRWLRVADTSLRHRWIRKMIGEPGVRCHRLDDVQDLPAHCPVRIFEDNTAAVWYNDGRAEVAQSGASRRTTPTILFNDLPVCLL